MSFGVKVNGGTGAGSKRPLLPANTIPWRCECIERDDPPSTTGRHKRLNPGYLVKCIDCGTQRP